MMDMNRYQAPPPEPNNDEAFLNLLSSQRELLNQLNRESAERKARAALGGAADPASMMMTSTSYYANNSFGVAPNRSICESSKTETVVYSKRLSLGLGNDMLAPSSFSFGDDSFTKLNAPLGLDATCDLDFSLHMTSSKQKRDKDDLGLDDIMSFSKKRRLSGAGLFNSLSLFVENAEQHKKFHPQRRLSFSPLGDRLQLGASSEDEDVAEDDDDLFLPRPLRAAAFALEQVPMPVSAPQSFAVVTPCPKPKPTKKAQPNLLEGLTGDPKVARKTMVSLSAAMEKSQKSQQDIHDWDRKMGLKRSHSKTMRLSTRSRKKLRAMLKKQINALASKKR